MGIAWFNLKSKEMKSSWDFNTQWLVRIKANVPPPFHWMSTVPEGQEQAITVHTSRFFKDMLVAELCKTWL